MAGYTPYLSPAVLVASDTGISWASISPGGDPSVTLQEQQRICQRVTSIIDGYCNQALRATLDVEFLDAPGDKAGVRRSTGDVRYLVDHWPILAILGIQVSGPGWPQQFISVPSTQYRAYKQVSDLSSGTGPTQVVLAAGFVDWGWGREAFTIQTQYLNGWPHSGLTQPTDRSSLTMTVDDVTGLLAGSSIPILDGAQTETVTVASTNPPQTASALLSGGPNPGTVTLTAPPTFVHQPTATSGALLSGLPTAVQQAAIWLATVQALTRGATGATYPAMRNEQTQQGGQSWLEESAFALLAPYRRLV